MVSKTVKFVFAILICQLAGILGSIFTSGSVSTWYVDIVKPFFVPPGWIFGPVWITLYFLMGISLYLVLVSKDNKIGLYLFFVQLVLNSLWSIIFFGLHWIFVGFLEMALLWVAILLTMLKFYKISKPAFYLLLPYILWVSFALVLNFSIFLLN